MFILKKSLFLECVQKVGTKVYIVVYAQAHDFQLLDVKPAHDLRNKKFGRAWYTPCVHCEVGIYWQQNSRIVVVEG